MFPDPATQTDQQLWQNYVSSGSERSFAEIVSRYQLLVLAACRLYGGRLDVDDQVQQVFVLLARKAPTLDACPHLASWLMAAARRVCANSRRGEQRRRQRETLAPPAVSAEPAPDAGLLAEEQRRAIMAALSELSDVQRDLVLRFYLQATPQKDLAKHYGISVDAIKQRLRVARRRLREELAAFGVGLAVMTSWASASAMHSFCQRAVIVPLRHASTLSARPLSIVGAISLVAGLTLVTCMALGFTGSSVTGQLAPALGQAESVPAVFQSQVMLTPQSWPIQRGHPNQCGAVRGHYAKRPQLAWNRSFDGGLVGGAVSDGTHIYLATLDNELLALNPHDGKEVWRVSLAKAVLQNIPVVGEALKPDFAPVTSLLLAADRLLVSRSDGGACAARLGDGKLLWSSNADLQVNGGANIVRLARGGSALIMGSDKHDLRAVDVKTGKLLWQADAADAINGTPSVSGSHVVVGTCGGEVQVYAGQTGIRQHSFNLGGYVPGTVAVDWPMLWAVNCDGKVAELVAVNTVTGKEVWRCEVGERMFDSAPAVSAERLIVANREAELVCVDRHDGRLLWRQDGAGASGPLVCDDVVLVHGEDGVLRSMRLLDGQVLWQHDLGFGSQAAPMICAGVMVCVGEDGEVQALRW